MKYLSKSDRVCKKVSVIHESLKDTDGVGSAPDDTAPEHGLVRVNGFCLPIELYELYLEVKKIFPDVKVWSPVGFRRVHVICRNVVVYRDYDVFAIGAIGYADYNIGRFNADNKYSVSSRLIATSGKLKEIRTINKKGNMKISKNFQTAVSYAKKYLVPYSGEEIHRAFISETRHELHRDSVNVENRFNRNLTAALRELSENAPLRLMSGPAGQVVIDNLETIFSIFPEESRLKLKELKEAVKEGEEALGSLYTVTLVFASKNKYLVHALHGQHSFEKLKDAAGMPYDSFEYPPEDLPEHLQGKMNLLMMVESGKFVRGVGYREGVNHFCVVDEVSHDD